MLQTPVVVIAFNRPRLAERTLAAVRAAAPQRLLVVADGPRPDRPGEDALCAETRAVLERVDWPCEVERRYAAANLGLEANVELGLDWVFSRVDRAIVLEDDCTPDPTFFRFAEELLERYRDDARVWQVAGNRHGVPPGMFHGDSYAFSTWASVWGWATWADRWQRHRAVFPRDHVRRSATDAGDAPVRREPAEPQPGTLVTRGGRRHFAEAARSDDVVTHGWDKHWWLTIMAAGGLSVTPAANLVENRGFGEDATHTSSAGRRDDPATPMGFPLRHPAAVALDEGVERELELHLNRIGGPAAQLARRVIRSPRLRRVARAAVNSGPALSAARLSARLTRRSADRG
ncbi:glycosyltransferase [Nocardioides panacisoli]|uniref:glycosyltransferase family 2 protein n=1 Tax=Nocardioides panacisoli TaxID=627624 RepID=UPI001C62FF74|nr:glycosyltransferase family 2 protein [Nocardioides panacisoli]QYJ03941.1 glycosyltransferase [Nocardioides panacisoli]